MTGFRLSRLGTEATAALTSERTGRATEIRSLTGLRGCAAVMVMLYHYSLTTPVYFQLVQQFLQNGYLCVDLFFVLSGFVMAYSQTGLFEPGYRLRNHGIYLASRLARIYPLYALITIESFCLLVWRSSDIDVIGLGRVLFLNLALIQAWGLAPSLEGATWSISTEWAAYLIFPLLLAACIFSSKRIAIAMTGAAVAAIAFVSASHEHIVFAGQGRSGPLDVYSSATALPVLRCLAEFTLGLISCRVARHWQNGLQRWARPLAWCALVAITAGLFTSGLDVAIVILFAVLILALVPQQGAVAAFLGGMVPYRLGQWSYAIYLIHDKFSHPVALMQVWLASRIPLAPEVSITAVAALVILIAAVTYFLIEVPLRKLAMKVVRGWRPASTASARTGGSGIENGIQGHGQPGSASPKRA